VREYEHTDDNCNDKNEYCESRSDEDVFEQLKNENMDSSSMDILRKLAFLKLVDASKKYHLDKLQGRDADALEKSKQIISKLYADYERVKNWK